MGFWDSSGISWTICKQSAPRSRQITTPTPHRSIFTGRMLFLTPNEQCKSTESKQYEPPKYEYDEETTTNIIDVNISNVCTSL